MKKKILLALACMALSMPICQAEIINIVETAEYTMADGETRNVASLRCIEQARRAVSERVGVYIESYSNVDKGILTEDLIKITSATIMKDRVQPIVKTTLTESGDICLVATVDVVIDTDEISGVVDKLKNDRQYQEDYEKILNKYKELEEENNRLKGEIANFGNSKEKEELASGNEMLYTSNDYVEAGMLAFNNDDYEISIGLLDKALEFNPANVDAYSARGVAYGKLGNYSKAIEDYDKCIQLQPERSLYYNLRGNAYKDLNMLDRANADFQKAGILEALESIPRY